MPIALITGTTAGIGAATAQILAKNGYDLILNGRRKDRLEEQSEEIKSQYAIKTKVMHVDVRDHDAVKQFIESRCVFTTFFRHSILSRISRVN